MIPIAKRPKSKVKIGLRWSPGFTFVEVMIVVVIMAIVGLSLSSVVQRFFKSMQSVQGVAEVDSLTQQIRSALANPEVCRGNFQGLANLSMTNPGGVSLRGLEYFDASGNRLNPPRMITAVGGDVGRSFTVRDLRLVPISQIGTDELAMEVRINYFARPGQTVQGSQTYTREIPVFVRAPGGVFLDCVNIRDIDDDRICRLASGGRSVWDPRTEQCVTRYDVKWYDQKEPVFATCPEGTTVPPGGAEARCRAIPPPSFFDDNELYRRRYEDGSFRWAPPTVEVLHREQNKCECIYELAVNKTGWICQVQCEFLKPE